MFESLSGRLNDVFDRLKRRGALREADVEAALRDIRVALLEADVALPVVKDFVGAIRKRAIGQEVLRSVNRQLIARNAKHMFVTVLYGTLHLPRRVLTLVRAGHEVTVFERDPAPIDPACTCPACTHHSRGYLRHLLRSGEGLGARLASLHNLTYYLNLMKRAREAIAAGRFTALHAELEALGERTPDGRG